MKNLFLFITIALISNQAYGSDTIKIAVLSGFTGDASLPSFHLLKTVEMEAARVNSAGGVRGQKIELIIIDDESNLLKTINISKDLDLKNLVGVIGFPWSEFILASGPVLQQRGIPSISIMATKDDATSFGDYIFRVCFTNTDQASKMMEFAYKNKKIRNAILFTNESNPFSSELSALFRMYFTRFGGRIVSEIKYIAKENTDYFLSALKKIRNEDYDGVFISDEEKFHATFFKISRRLI